MTEQQLIKGNECIDKMFKVRRDFQVIQTAFESQFWTNIFSEFLKTTLIAAEQIRDNEIAELKKELEAL